MQSSARYKHQLLALFFTVSLTPALVVVLIWYVIMPGNINDWGGSHVVIPMYLVAILPALALSLLFAERLSRPVRRIRTAALELARGHYDQTGITTKVGGEFGDVANALAELGRELQRVMSETASETGLIAAERNKLQVVLNSMTDGVFALDRDGRIMLFNHAASSLTGRGIAEVAGQLAEKVMPLRQNGELVMNRWLATQHGEGSQVGTWHSLELYRGDGTSLFVDVQAKLLPNDPNGIRALITFHDLTPDHQLEEMKVDFVALAAHELRTPLTELRGYLDVLETEVKGLRKSDRVWLERSVASSTELAGLISNLLSVARIEHGDDGYHPSQLMYKALISDIVTAHQPVYGAKGVTLAMKLPSQLPQLFADPVGVREVLNNLLGNALTHTPKGGKVTITATTERSEIETTVTDTGTGIPATALPRLFTKFYRVSEFAATTRGTGLGLFISKSIIEAHGGHMWVESTVGKGSSFSFRLPVAAKPSTSDNESKITRGAHGWIKTHLNR